jgi:hypothetical protein
MTELKLPGFDQDQLGPLGWVERVGGKTQLDCRRQHGSQTGRLVGGRCQ